MIEPLDALLIICFGILLAETISLFAMKAVTEKIMGNTKKGYLLPLLLFIYLSAFFAGLIPLWNFSLLLMQTKQDDLHIMFQISVFTLGVVVFFLPRYNFSEGKFKDKKTIAAEQAICSVVKQSAQVLFKSILGLFTLGLILGSIALGFLWLIGRGMGAPGRPFRSRGKFLTTTAEERNDWTSNLQLSPENLTPEIRKQLSDAWLELAAAEHASVATFSKLSLQLMVLGAPPELLKACHQAGIDEVEHARCCYTLAGIYGGQTFGASPFTALNGIALEKITLEQLALESLQDGCLMEGYFSAYFQMAAQHAIDPVLKANLTTLADDEARHADLAWNIVAWYLKSSGTQEQYLIQKALAHLPKQLTIESYDALALATSNQHGFLTKTMQDDVYNSVLKAVNEKTCVLLAL